MFVFYLESVFRDVLSRGSPCAFGHCSGSTFLRTGMLLKRMKETAMTRMFRDVGMRCRKDVMAKMDQTSSVACELSFEN